MKRRELVHAPPLGHEVQQVWVAILEHGPGDEAVPGVTIPGAVVTLFVAKPSRIPWLYQQARSLAKDSGKRVRVACFSVRENLEVYEP